MDAPPETESAHEENASFVPEAPVQVAFPFEEAKAVPSLPDRPERFGSRNRRTNGSHSEMPASEPAEAITEGILAEPPSTQRRTRRSTSEERPEAATGTETPKRSRTRSASAPASPPSPKIDPPERFRALGVDETGLAALAALGFATPTPIQEQSIAALLGGQDVVGLAQTGTGKTLAFGLPLAAAIDAGNPALQALVLVPTRELAKQVSETLQQLALFYHFSVVTLTGGTRVAGDITKLRDGAQVMVGTPGRVIDHLKRGNLDLRAIRFAVLDEADEMLDIGFARDIDYILRSVPKDRQTALFSATMPESIRRLVWRYMRNSIEISVEPERRTAENVTQLVCEVAVRDKAAALLHLHRTLDLGRSLVFRKMKISVDRLTVQLQNAGISARAIHGDLAQSERDAVLAGFKRGDIQFLVATNVAARGLDIPDVEHVINFDVPQNAEEYIHRIGRTARAGKKGSAITFVGEWELQEWDAILREVGEERIEKLELPRRL